MRDRKKTGGERRQAGEGKPAASIKGSGTPEESLSAFMEGCPAAGVICRVGIGDLIHAVEKICEEAWVHTERTRTYEVKKIYPHHVLTEDAETGQRRCFCYGDLILMGLEWQEPKLEQLRSAGNGSKYR